MRCPVKLTARMSRRAGFYKWDDDLMGTVTINTALCNTAERFRSTLLHELAHGLVRWACDSIQNGQRVRLLPHGKAWKAWQVRIGADPNYVTHNYELPTGYYTEAVCAKGCKVNLTHSYIARIKRGGSYQCIKHREKIMVPGLAIDAVFGRDLPPALSNQYAGMAGLTLTNELLAILKKNETKYQSLNRLAADPRITRIWEENNGIWAELAEGYNWEGCSCLHESKPSELMAALDAVEKGPTY